MVVYQFGNRTSPAVVELWGAFQLRDDIDRSSRIGIVAKPCTNALQCLRRQRAVRMPVHAAHWLQKTDVDGYGWLVLNGGHGMRWRVLCLDGDPYRPDRHGVVKSSLIGASASRAGRFRHRGTESGLYQALGSAELRLLKHVCIQIRGLGVLRALRVYLRPRRRSYRRQLI